MAQNNKTVKKPVSRERIYLIMLLVAIGVSSLFLLKNLLGDNIQAATVIGAVLLVVVIALIVMKIKKVRSVVKETVLSIGLIFVVFIISLYSGASYSDDFCLYLAIIGMTGLYLEPKITRVQIVLSDVVLVIMYLIHPEKAESQSQYILCMAVFTLAAVLFYLTIKRGQAYINIAQEQAEASEQLLTSMRSMGEELQVDFDSSSKRIEESTMGLQGGSASITKGANDVFDGCNEVHDKIEATTYQLNELNSQVREFEKALTENQDNIKEMQTQLHAVSETIQTADEVFNDMSKKMNDVSKIAEELGTISFKTTLLSLNASVEAAHAGKSGAGFAVVASEMKDLSENSDKFSEQVSDVVKELLEQVQMTAMQFIDSTEALYNSETAMNELQAGFTKLIEQFEELYSNINLQTDTVNQVDYIFGELKEKVSEMKNYSEDNQYAVEEISKAMESYKTDINRVIENTRKV